MWSLTGVVDGAIRGITASQPACIELFKNACIELGFLLVGW